MARALGVSLTELLTGDLKTNENQSGNMKKVQFYVCPICGNVITALGGGSFSCCGIALPIQEAECMDDEHFVQVETIDGEYAVAMNRPMTKSHYISFLSYVTSNSAEMIKLYPEQEIFVRFRKNGHGILYAYCNKHGLYRKLI